MATWVEDIIAAFQNLGGEASYDDLFDELKQIRSSPLPASWKDMVRARIEERSSDSDAYLGGGDLFYAPEGKGQGVWALRTELDKETSVRANTGLQLYMDVISDRRREEFVSLFQEFIVEYPPTTDGQRHVRAYSDDQVSSRAGLDQVIEAQQRGEDITDLVLLKLLPHSNTEHNQKKGAWICIAPAVTRDVKQWFEGAKWTKKEDWPRVSEAIFRFLERCERNPSELPIACEEFAKSGYGKGFQSGMLSPALSGLSPDEFILINSKSRKTVNYLTEKNYSTRIVNYPETNVAAKDLIASLGSDIERLSDLDLANHQVFDMFCHWLVAVSRFDFAGTRYWKIAPGENARFWGQCKNNGYIGVGWDKLGDLTGLNKEEFYAAYGEVSTTDPTYTKSGAGQVWKFLNIQEGDRIVANRGTSTVVGIGTVTGPYYRVLDVLHDDDDDNEFSHRLPVDWDDITPRTVDQPGWRRTLIKLDYETFKDVSEAPQDTHSLAPPFSQIFSSRDEAERAFGISAIVLEGLGVNLPDQDERVAFLPSGVPAKGNWGKLRINYGNWLLLSFHRKAHLAQRRNSITPCMRCTLV